MRMEERPSCDELAHPVGSDLSGRKIGRGVVAVGEAATIERGSPRRT
jgi:hypothetical protein